MQYKKLTHEQRCIRQWRVKRNKILARILKDNPVMLRRKAERLANQEAGRMPVGRKRKAKESKA